MKGMLPDEAELKTEEARKARKADKQAGVESVRQLSPTSMLDEIQ